MTKEQVVKLAPLSRNVIHNTSVRQIFAVKQTRRSSGRKAIKAHLVTEFLTKQKQATQARPTYKYIPNSDTSLLLFTH